MPVDPALDRRPVGRLNRSVERNLIPRWTGRAHHRAASLREGGKRDRDDKHRAVEERLDEEGAAELLDPGDADGEDKDAADRAPEGGVRAAIGSRSPAGLAGLVRLPRRAA